MVLRQTVGNPRRQIKAERGVQTTFITSARVVDGRIEVTSRGSRAVYSPKPVGDTVSAAQLTDHVVASTIVHGGTWTSIETVKGLVWAARALALWLVDKHDIDDLTDERLAPGMLHDGVLACARSSGTRRNLRAFLARLMPDLRADGDAFRDLLVAYSFPVDDSRVEGYEPDVADQIERVARAHVSAWFIRYRAAVTNAFDGDLPRHWLQLDAEQLLEVADSDDPALYPTRDNLTAAMTLLALADNRGPNLSTIQSYTSTSVERANHDAAFTTGVKARNRTVLRGPAPANGIFSYGGLLEFVAAATLLARHRREGSQDFRRLLFVDEHGRSPVNTTDVQLWWWGTESDWGDPGLTRPATISFRRLRKAAELRAKRAGQPGVIGHSKKTSKLYLADAVPDVILVPGLLSTQSSMAEEARRRAKQADPESSDAVDRLASAPQVMDVGVALCASNGQSPQDPAKPCGLGPSACFFCKNGYRTPEVVPGLLATVQFTDNIRKYEPGEWINGEAPRLNLLAKRALEQFPVAMVEAVPAEAVANSRAIVACVYVEGRRSE